ncbi:MAG: hypothetical protein NG740_03190 [Omnitrophica bacterium]|nr:hypothetical protein [Candidatus Omnitrophota bacterium]
MSNEFEFYHGVALCRLIHDKRLQSVALFRTDRNSSYLINVSIGIFIKYSTKRLTPWYFTFMPHHIEEFFDLTKHKLKTFLLLVCKNDGIVCLNVTEVKMVLDIEYTKNQGISVSRRPREKYKISGPLDNIKYKFGDNEFPEKIFR